jgi:uncharacterized protein
VTRGGAKKDRTEPERRCVVTRATAPRAGLVRFVVAPDGEVVPDVAERLPGRGIWVSADRAAVTRAAAKGLFARAARGPARADPELAGRVEALIARRLIELIALARKAGLAVAGLEKTRAALVSGEAALLLQAADGSARGRAALRPPEGENAHVTCLSGHELGLAFGRDSVIHAALSAGALTDRVGREALRLAGMREMTAGGPAAGDASAGEGSRLERLVEE